MKMCRSVLVFVVMSLVAVFQPFARAQLASNAAAPGESQTQAQAPRQVAAVSSSIAASMHLELAYDRPTEREKLKTYAFDTFGPYAFLGSAFSP